MEFNRLDTFNIGLVGYVYGLMVVHVYVMVCVCSLCTCIVCSCVHVRCVHVYMYGVFMCTCMVCSCVQVWCVHVVWVFPRAAFVD